MISSILPAILPTVGKLVDIMAGDKELHTRAKLSQLPRDAFEGLGQALAEQGKQVEAQEALNRSRELKLKNP